MKYARHSLLSYRKGNKGAALIAALIILLMVTLIGTTGMEDTISENRMTLNFRDRRMAVAAADSGIRAAELWLTNMTIEPALANVTDCKGKLPLCGQTAGNYPIWEVKGPDMKQFTWKTANWPFWTELGVKFRGTTTRDSSLGDKFADQPRTVIQKRELPTNLNVDAASQGSGWNYYNVISSGTGFRDDSRAVVVSTFQKWL
jgi:Tfp pilus assembly protein PilX